MTIHTLSPAWFPLSASQQSRWFLYQLEPDSQGSHNNGFAVRVHGAIDAAALTGALQVLVQRHPMLRASFRAAGDKPEQHIACSAVPRVHSCDMTGLDDGAIEQQVARDCGVPFDLSTAPLMRAHLYQRAAGDAVLLLVFDHIVCDGWSYWQLLEELGTVLGGGQLPELAGDPHTASYAAHVMAQQEAAQGARAQAQWQYWQKNLEGELPELQLPADRPHAASAKRASHKLTLPATLTQSLRALTRQNAGTMFTTLLAAYGLLLRGVTGQDDIVVGTPMPGRTRKEFDQVVGDFVNAIPVRMRFDAEHTVGQALRAVRDTTMRGMAHQELPFATLVERLAPGRRSSGHPIFQTAFIFQKARHGADLLRLWSSAGAATPVQWGGLELRSFPVHQSGGNSALPLVLEVLEIDDNVECAFQFDGGRFEPATMARWASHFCTLLEQLVAQDAPRIGALSLLTEAQRHGLLVEWNATAAPYPLDACAHQVFERDVERHPHSVAIVCGADLLTYRELNARANRVAHHLIALGVRPDDRVALCLERSVDMIVGLLGIAKAGAAYVPLDPVYPDERLAHMLADSRPAALVSQAALEGRFDPVVPRVLLGLQATALHTDDSNPAPAGLAPEHLAYVIYTSGSTGLPKGVMVEHRNLMSSTQARLDLYPAQQQFLLIPSIGFDCAIAAIFGTLLSGGTLHIAGADLAQDPQQLACYVEGQGIGSLLCVPSLARLIIGGLDRAHTHPLQALIVGGEACPVALRAEAAALTPPLAVYNEYGPTETTIWATSYCLDTGHHEPVPIGRPIANARIYLLDAVGQPVPVGVAGEICIGGAGVARGYLFQAALTEERFVADPFAGAPGARMYRTGDLGRYLADGQIEYLGRNDFQVKIRGFRIELGEIEACLLACAGVAEAAVLAREDQPGDKRLVAYVAAADDIDLAQLRAQLRAVLPEYMLPSAFVVLASLAKTPNGKVDRHALPRPDMADMQAAYTAPATPTESLLCAIWQDVLGVEQVGTGDNFFHLGGHSLMVMSVIARVQDTGRGMTARQLFAASTLAELAAAIDAAPAQIVAPFQAPPNRIPAGCTAITPDMLPLVSLNERELAQIVSQVPGGAANIEDIYPLGPLQEGILFHHILSSQGDPYILPVVFTVDGDQALDSYLAALQVVIDRHDVLRTAVIWEQLPAAVQVVQRHVVLPVTWVTPEHGQSAMAAIEALAAPERQAMDLRYPSLLKLHIVRDPQGLHHVGLIQLHHIVSDHVGLAIIRSELAAIVAGLAHGLAAPVPYREFIAQARHLAETHDAEAYFRATLGDIDTPTAPFELLDVQGDGSSIVELHQPLPAALSIEVRQAAKAARVSPAALFHAAWALVVARCSGRDDVVFGTVVSGRLQGTTGAEHMLGVFINTLPLRVKLAGQGVGECVRQVYDSLLELLPYEQASLSLAQRSTLVPSGTPLFSAMLNYRHSEPQAVPQEQQVHYLSARERTNYPFNLAVDDLGEGFALDVQVDASLSAERIARYVETALQLIVAALRDRPETALSEITIVPEQERRQLLVEWNDTAVPASGSACVHQLFEQQAALHPDTVAVVCGQDSLSYHELNAQANQLAHHLLDMGVQPDDRVGLCLERGVAMIVGLLGIAKAGAAYVPLDPVYPDERLGHMLADCAPAALVTQPHLASRFGAAVPLVLLDGDTPALHANENNPAPASLAHHHLAYVIYTSGSTGLPKGVMVEHRNLSSSIQARLDLYPGRQQFLLIPSIGFDCAIAGVFGTLLSAGTLHLADAHLAQDPQQLARHVDRHAITSLLCVPSLARMILEHLDTGPAHTLQALIVGGEACPAALRTQAAAMRPQLAVYNEYGPTEATIWATSYLLNQGRHEPVPIGRPIANARIYLLDAESKPVPLGVPGEIYIGGAGIARGYLFQPALTAQRFMADPFSPDAGARMYRTGDLGRYLADGQIEYLGRNDFQVKIRGFRIELGEIEARLLACDGVREAAVLAREDQPGDKRLVAYVVGTPGVEGGPALREQLLAVLPEYMIPSAFVTLDALPKTPNGKLDQRALPAPDYSALAAASYVEPRTATERLLCDIWQNVLGVGRVGISDNFFHLGGHSLLVMHVISQLQQAGVSMSARELFASPDLESLAAALDAQSGVQAPAFAAPPNLIGPETEAITPSMVPLVALSAQDIATIVAHVPGGAPNVQDIYPLGPLQEGILFHHTMSSEGDPYILPALFSVAGDAALAEVLVNLQRVIDRHDVLRTAILWHGLTVPVQVVYRHVQLPVQHVELAPGQDALAVMQLRSAAGAQRMDLGQPSLMRLQIARDSAADRHIVLVQLHHIISDHVGLEVIQAELAALKAGTADHLPEPVPYREFIAHTQHQMRHHDAQAFFRTVLGDIESPTAPFELLDVQGDGSAILELRVAVPTEVAEAVRRVARSMRLSPASLFHAAWAMVVGACSSRDDVVFGTVVSGRLQGTAGSEHMIGVFINTLPLRVRLGTHSAAQCVQAVHQSLLELLPYEQTSLALAQRCSAVPPGVPLFSAMLNYRHSAPVGDATHAGDAGFEYLGGQERTNYPLTLSVDDYGHEFELDLQVHASLKVDCIAGYMQTALAGLVAALESSPDRAVAHISVLPQDELDQLLVRWNDTARSYPHDQCIHTVFEELAQRQPDAVALVHEGRHVSYDELNRLANGVAHELIAAGVGVDERVAICAERSIAMVAGILGILKAGAAYVPLNPGYPTERLAYLLEDCAPSALVAQEHLLPLLPASSVEDLPRVKLDEATLGRADNPCVQVGPRHLAYVIYTSGSTGQPKGVMVEHRNVLRLVMNNHYAPLEAGDCVAQCANVAFDASTWEIWGALLSGARLLLVPEAVVLDAAAFSRALIDGGVTALWMTVGLFNEYVDVCAEAFGHLRYLLVGGDALDPNSIGRLLSGQRPPRLLVNGYGPTETTTFAATHEIAAVGPDTRSIPIGRPIANTRIYILDCHGRPAPRGVAGEIFIGGPGVARGYLARPQLTAERFIADPFSSVPCDRLYKTGDLGRWLADGTIEYLGRNDFQVKIRGFRIELGEVEARLSSLPGVREARVLARDDGPGEKRLVAYVVPADGVVPVVAQLRMQLAAVMPDYMVPSAFVVLDAFPLTPNGKLDRAALPAPERADLATDAYVAPRTATESLLCAVWQDVLGISQIGVNDNFFQLGGHSLLVMQVISRLQQAGVTMGARQLFACPTLGELALAIDAGADGGTAFAAPPNLITPECGQITPAMLPLVELSADDIARVLEQVPGGVANVQDMYALGPLQEGILFHHMMQAEGDPYILPALFSIDGAAALEGFLEALRFVMARHDVLRTAILWEGLSTPVQVVCRHAELPVGWVELAAGQDALEAMRELAAPERQRMDLSRAPLLQLQIARAAGSEQHVVLLQSHHIVSDHVGLEIIQRELALFQMGQGATLAAPVPYREFIAHTQHQQRHSDAEAFFKATLGDVDAPTAPFELLDVRSDGSRIVELREEVPAAVGVALRRLAKEHRVSPAALFHTAWAMVVGLCSGRDDVVFGTVVSGRLQGTRGAESMLGVFINTLPLRVRLSGAGAADCVQQVHQGLLDLLPYEQASLALAQRSTRIAGGAPLFSAILNYRHSASAEDGAGMRAGAVEIAHLGGQERTNYPFNLSVDDMGTRFELDVLVDASIGAARIAAYMQTALASLAEALEQAPHSAVTTLAVLGQAERTYLAETCNDTAAEYARGTCMHELFEEQARVKPGACAVQHEGRQLTYGELNARANQLAHYLRSERGAVPGSLIGVCMDRSPELVVAILGILKSGAAYVPLDPAYPEARLAYMLADARLDTVITEQGLPSQAGVAPSVALCLEDVQFAAQPADNLDARDIGLRVSDLAYVIYTSGSTGQPKGVMIEHRNAAAFLSWASGVFSAEQLRCVLASTSVCFDLSIFEMFAPLSTGGSLLIVRNVLELAGSEHAGQVTLINTVPSAAEALLQVGSFPESARTINLAGEPLKQRTVDRLYEAGMERVYDLYGPSEDTTYSTYVLRTPGGAYSIGRPIDNTQVYLLNQSMQLVPAGCPGELYIGGAGLARGYLNRADLTAEKFVASPFGVDQCLYRTGDLARWLPDGNLEYLGRIDHQVKIRGFRIELGEIENALVACEGVAEAVVVAREASAGDKRLVAYIGATGGDADLVERLRRTLGQRLPEYMVPSSFVLLDQLPLTPNGKVDRKALPEPDAASAQAPYVAPRTEMEKTLCRIWQELLGVERVGVNDGFFDLGGHSLLAMRLIADIQAAFGIKVQVRALFEQNTVAQLAAYLELTEVQAAPQAIGRRHEAVEPTQSEEIEL